MVAKQQQQQQQKTTYLAKVTGRHAVTLPAKLCRTLAIENGDMVEFEVIGNQAVVRKVEPFDPSSLRGILAEDFRDWDDIVSFIEEERAGWERPWDRDLFPPDESTEPTK